MALRSTASSLIYLEFGVVPIQQEIDINKLMFLYHILNFEVDDPIENMYEILKGIVGSTNYSTECQGIRNKYEIEYDDGEITKMMRYSWKNIVRSSVEAYTSDANNGR